MLPSERSERTQSLATSASAHMASLPRMPA